MEQIIVVGGGAAGMTAAITAARCGAEVIILEAGERLGKKLLSTGNGKCNYTNFHMDETCFRSDNMEYVSHVLKHYPTERILDFFESLGILPYSKNGYIYPRSEQAASVLECLLREIERLSVHVLFGWRVQDIKVKDGTYTIISDRGSLTTEKLILAPGGMAAPKTGSDGTVLTIAKHLGYHLVQTAPALVQLKVKENFMGAVSGVRTQARVSIYNPEGLLASDRGEVQLTDYGISGIPVFQVSRFAAKALQEKQPVTAVLDFLPEMSRKEAEDLLRDRRKTHPDWKEEELLLGVFPKKLATLIAKEYRNRFPEGCKEFTLKVIGTQGYESAQVTAGGVKLSQLDLDSLQSLKHPGLYFAGEILDVDGICGGYNLHWAWATGMITGAHAAGFSSSVFHSRNDRKADAITQKEANESVKPDKIAKTDKRMKPDKKVKPDKKAVKDKTEKLNRKKKTENKLSFSIKPREKNCKRG